MKKFLIQKEYAPHVLAMSKALRERGQEIGSREAIEEYLRIMGHVAGAGVECFSDSDTKTREELTSAFDDAFSEGIANFRDTMKDLSGD